jgi:hypothetical protein
MEAISKLPHCLYDRLPGLAFFPRFVALCAFHVLFHMGGAAWGQQGAVENVMDEFSAKYILLATQDSPVASSQCQFKERNNLLLAPEHENSL